MLHTRLSAVNAAAAAHHGPPATWRIAIHASASASTIVIAAMPATVRRSHWTRFMAPGAWSARPRGGSAAAS